MRKPPTLPRAQSQHAAPKTFVSIRRQHIRCCCCVSFPISFALMRSLSIQRRYASARYALCRSAFRAQGIFSCERVLFTKFYYNSRSLILYLSMRILNCLYIIICTAQLYYTRRFKKRNVFCWETYKFERPITHRAADSLRIWITWFDLDFSADCCAAHTFSSIKLFSVIFILFFRKFKIFLFFSWAGRWVVVLRLSSGKNKRRAVDGLNISFKPNKAFHHILCCLIIIINSNCIQNWQMLFHLNEREMSNSLIQVLIQIISAGVVCIKFNTRLNKVVLYYSDAAITKSLADFLFSFYSDFGRIYLYLYQSCIYILCAAHGNGCLWMGISYKSILYIKYGFGYVYLGADLLSKKETSQLILICYMKTWKNKFFHLGPTLSSFLIPFSDVLRGLNSWLFKK